MTKDTGQVIAGARGTARLGVFPDSVLAAHPGHLAVWLLEAPCYHPFWSRYVCSLVHLRTAPDDVPAKLHYPGAEHEILIWAARFENPADVEDPMKWGANILTPQNLVFQFHGLVDVGAIALLERLVRAYCEGSLSPDTDFRTLQIETLRAWVMEGVERRRKAH